MTIEWISRCIRVSWHARRDWISRLVVAGRQKMAENASYLFIPPHYSHAHRQKDKPVENIIRLAKRFDTPGEDDICAAN
jgi:hypothetical protein